MNTYKNVTKQDQKSIIPLTLHSLGGWGAHCARSSENMLLFFTVWSEGPQILVQFIYHSDIGCTESLEPKVCLRKKLEHVF